MTSRTSCTAPAGVFVTTRWTAVLAAGKALSPEADHALEELCRAYWFPLYAYARRRGNSPEDAQDLTQAFFARLLEKNWLNRADREQGRFRSFLLGAFDHFLANEWRKEQTLKRGGGAKIIPLQLDTAETRYGREPADSATPERLFERRWATALLDEVLKRLGEEVKQAGKAEGFPLLMPCLVGDRSALPYAGLAAKLGTSEGALKVTVHRLRQRYRQLLREEVAQTVASPTEVDAELSHLIRVVAGS